MNEASQHAKRRRLIIIVGVLLLMAVGLTIVAFRALHEPVEEGKTASYWVSQLGEPERAAGKARLALDKLGATNTILCLASKLGQKDPGWYRFYRTHYQQLPGFILNRLKPPREPVTAGARTQIAYYICSLARQSPTDTKPAVPRLVSLLPDSDAAVRFGAGLALSAFGTNAAPAVPVICRMLDTEPQKVHDVMLVVLENCGPAARTTIPVLQRCLASPNAGVRIRCARTLWLLDKDQADAVRPLAKMALGEADAGIRIEAASLLWRIDKDPKEVVPALAALLGDTDHAFDHRTIRLLGQIGPGAKEAIPALTDWLKASSGGQASNSAVEALHKMGAAP